jgi:transketolase
MAIEEARNDEEHPSLIEVRTTIGYVLPNKSGKFAVHGAPIGTEEMKLTK